MTWGKIASAKRLRGDGMPPREVANHLGVSLAVQLSAVGHFTWTEWTTALGDQLQAAADRGAPDDGSRYFEHWLAALEQLVTEKQLTDRTALRERQGAWADAYRHTPHGHPVELGAQWSPPGVTS
jgi:nitrile hydratase accessory protein